MNKENFFERKGFYIILLLCATAIGVAGYVSFMNNSSKKLILEEPNISVTAPKENVVMENITPTPIEKKPEITEEETIKEEPAAIIETPVETPVIQPETQITKEKETIYKKPVDGEIINVYSNNELVFDETMKVWRTHNATDYRVSSGENVLAIADGTVRSVTHDDLYQTTVTIEHVGGITTKTYGLSPDVNVVVDDKVYCLDVIGEAYGVFLAEEKLGEHIHIEAFKDGNSIDIETLFLE